MSRLNILYAGLMIIVLMYGRAIALEPVFCEGVYGGHLQGIAVDPGRAIYWSFTVDLVKTDLDGNFLTSVPVASHHGDLTCHNGTIHVAVNLGEFNREPGHADSWVYVYDADDLTFISKHQTQEVVHGAGGIASLNGHFYVVGGLPEGYRENYVYEYDENYNFVSRHILSTGYTLMGIQTACCAFGNFWYGCYGYPDNKPLFKSTQSFKVKGSYDTDFSVGIDIFPGKKLCRGFTWHLGKNKYWRGKIEIIDAENFLNE